MALIFETIETPGIALLSYVIGDDETGTAAVIDPRPDVECYIEVIRKRKLSITHIFETHIHADFMSGSQELSARLQTAKIYVSKEGGASYGYTHEAVNDGDEFLFGSVKLTAKHTPGHTPEHMSYVATDSKGKKTSLPWGVFSGDTLFVNSAGRPDLMGEDESEKLAEALFKSLRDFFLTLPDSVIIYPAHGHGSPCGASIGDRLTSTIGYERKFNPFLQITDLTEFKEFAIKGAPPEPTYYRPMKKLNAKGAPLLHNLPLVPALPPSKFKEIIGDGKTTLIDTRQMLAFGGGHIQGALNLGSLPELSVWAGWLVDPNTPICLVLENDTALQKVVALFLRTGFTKFAGYLVGGMRAWDNAGFELDHIKQVDVHELETKIDEVQIIDVRAPSEWNEGHIPNAKHIFLPELEKESGQLDPKLPLVVYCDSGYRASLATSILKNNAFKDVSNVPGSWQAWKNSGYPIEKENQK